MALEIRPCRDADEMAEYGRIVSYVFASTEGMDEELSTTQPDWTMCAFVDGQMAGTMGVFPFTVRLNGVPVSMGGVTAVGTLPGYRRQGLLRKIMTDGLAVMRDRRQSYAILWASMAAIYQRFGYGLASTQVRYSFDPRYVALQDNAPVPGSIDLMNKEDAFPIVKQLYIRHATSRNLHIHRSVPLWDASTFHPPKKGQPLYVAVYRDGEGEPRGHLIYTTAEDERTGPGPGQKMVVNDFIALDLGAHRALWEYIRRHDLVGRVEMNGVVPEDDPSPSLLLEPRMLNRSTSDQIWMRIVDVEQAIPQRPYGARGELTFKVDKDDICPWNNGTYLMETDGQITELRRTDREPQLTMTPNTLASLLAGHRTATYHERAGQLEVRDRSALATADAIFRPEYAPHCPNSF